jgi:hypothetical protein
MIVDFLCDEDIYNLTRVARYMAAIGCPIYLRRKGINLSASGFSLSVWAEGFKALSIWRRSPDFSARPMLFCNFDFIDSDRVAVEMRWLQKFFISLPLPSPPLFRHVCLHNVETAKLQSCLDLLQTVSYKTCCRAITITGVAFQDARMGWKKKNDGILLKGVQELTFEHCHLSPSQWMNLLSKLRIPALCEFTVVGETSMVALYHFLRRHPHVRVLDLRCTTKDIPLSSRQLILPDLWSLRGSSSHILHLLQSLPTPPSIGKLAVESDSPVSPRDDALFDDIMRCLMMCNGSLTLEIRLSKEASEVELTRTKSWVSGTNRSCSIKLPCTVSTLCIEYEGVCDELLLVCVNNRSLTRTDLYSC